MTRILTLVLCFALFSIFACKTYKVGPTQPVVASIDTTNFLTVPLTSPAFYVFPVTRPAPKYDQALMNQIGDSLVATLIVAGLPLTDCWYPLGPVGCQKASAVLAIMVQLAAPDSSIIKLGWLSDNTRYDANCGVYHLFHRHYGHSE